MALTGIRCEGLHRRLEAHVGLLHKEEENKVSSKEEESHEAIVSIRMKIHMEWNKQRPGGR